MGTKLRREGSAPGLLRGVDEEPGSAPVGGLDLTDALTIAIINMGIVT